MIEAKRTEGMNYIKPAAMIPVDTTVSSSFGIGFPLSVPVLSWLFGAGKARKSVPSPSPADTRRSLATLAAQAAANSRRVELGPRAQPSSQSFSEVTDPFCRLPLPTLFHRPEAVHLGDLMRL
ncbi:hypothetical protein Bca4012_103512 [Brassica carinata]